MYLIAKINFSERGESNTLELCSVIQFFISLHDQFQSKNQSNLANFYNIKRYSPEEILINLLEILKNGPINRSY